jgi:cell division protein FtsB
MKTPIIKSKIVKIATALLGAVIIIAMAFPIYRNLSKRYQIDQEIKDLQANASKVNADNLKLKELMNYYQSNSFIEEKAKENLNFKKEGEEVVVIKNLDADKISADEPSSDQVFAPGRAANYNQPGNPAKWWRYFFYR